MSEERAEDTRRETGAKSADDEQRGPTQEEEMRGAQAPNDDPSGDAVLQHDVRDTGKVQDVVDLDEVNETGSLRSAHHRPHA